MSMTNELTLSICQNVHVPDCEIILNNTIQHDIRLTEDARTQLIFKFTQRITSTEIRQTSF